jgi:hypothetical protein
VDNIKIDLREIGWVFMDWIDLAQDREQWRALVNTVMNLVFHKMLGRSWVAAQLAASQEGLSSMRVVICVKVPFSITSRMLTGVKVQILFSSNSLKYI